MIIGVPKEIKNNENRVALTPAGPLELTKRNHSVYVQSSAGDGSGFPDEDYIAAGAQVRATIEGVYEIAEMIIKVKEPIASEYDLIKENQLVFTYFHFASYQPLTEAMIKSKAICLAYETVELEDRSLPLLVPMSEVAGRMAIQQGAKYLEKPMKGRGVLLGGGRRGLRWKGVDGGPGASIEIKARGLAGAVEWSFAGYARSAHGFGIGGISGCAWCLGGGKCGERVGANLLCRSSRLCQSSGGIGTCLGHTGRGLRRAFSRVCQF